LSEHELKAECIGEHYSPSRHQLKLGVKSATYHLLQVDTGANKVRVIFDV
jgi:SHS2 domain-containing protein